MNNINICKDYNKNRTFCEHNILKTVCIDCKGGSICEHNKNRSKCIICKPSLICEHNILKNKCKTCNPNILCIHNKQKTKCIKCNGGSICEHNKEKYTCKICKGTGICEHNMTKYNCSICRENGYCEHNILKTQCKICKGSAFCIHNIRKSNCKECGGSSFCIHGKIKCNCKECSPHLFCEHNTKKSRCKLCDGSEICEHNKRKSSCPDCDGIYICKSRYDPYNTGCRQLGNKKYNGFCTFCFSNLFPNNPLTCQIYKKSKELQVVNYISTLYDGFIHDKCLYVDLEGGCCESKRRIDLRKLINNTMLCIEIDENQHKNYIKFDEEYRYDDLFMDFSGKYIFIRYNPDQYKDKDKKNKNPLFITRMNYLKKTINDQIEKINNYKNNDIIEIIHLYYDE